MAGLASVVYAMLDVAVDAIDNVTVIVNSTVTNVKYNAEVLQDDATESLDSIVAFIAKTSSTYQFDDSTVRDAIDGACVKTERQRTERTDGRTVVGLVVVAWSAKCRPLLLDLWVCVRVCGVWVVFSSP